MQPRWVVFCLFFSTLVSAQPMGFPPGEYLTDGGWGSMLLKPVREGRQDFEIDTLRANGHTCWLEGEVEAGKAILLNDDDKKRACIIHFTSKNGSIDVTTRTPGACQDYCGARAWFEGIYHTPNSGCHTASLSQTRNRFKGLYDRQQFAEAEKVLVSVLENCQKTLTWLETGRIRNDLALTQAKLGNGAACRETLKPLAEDAARTDAAVCDHDQVYLPPVDCAAYLAIVRAARTNLKWCARAGREK